MPDAEPIAYKPLPRPPWAQTCYECLHIVDSCIVATEGRWSLSVYPKDLTRWLWFIKVRNETKAARRWRKRGVRGERGGGQLYWEGVVREGGRVCCLTVLCGIRWSRTSALKCAVRGKREVSCEFLRLLLLQRKCVSFQIKASPLLEFPSNPLDSLVWPKPAVNGRVRFKGVFLCFFFFSVISADFLASLVRFSPAYRQDGRSPAPFSTLTQLLSVFFRPGASLTALTLLQLLTLTQKWRP